MKRCLTTSGTPWCAPLPVALVIGLCISIPAICQAQDSRNHTPEQIVVPSGTPVQLRFVHAVVGYPWEAAVKKGDVVRLVVAKDVSIGGKVIITKGALAQASVTSTRAESKWQRIYDRLSDAEPPTILTPFRLQLQWAESISAVQLPLAPVPKQRSKPFFVEVYAVGSGFVAWPSLWDADRRQPRIMKAHELCPEQLYRPMQRKPDIIDIITTDLHDRRQFQIPAGARLTAFVDGDVRLDATEIEHAQATLPAQNEAAVLSLYREPDVDRKCGKEKAGDNKYGPSPDLHCGQRNLGTLETKQYRMVELAPGKHSCWVDGYAAVDLTVAAGDEVFVRVSKNKKSGAWELRMVDPIEAEDTVAGYKLRSD